MHIEKLTKQGLKKFLETGRWESYDFLPISKHRAESQLQNPSAKEDDVLLLLALEGEVLAGYLGCLPDQIIIEERCYNFAWLSTLYVSDKFRGKKIAQKLLEEANACYHNRIAITEFTPEAEALYNKTGFFDYLEPKNGWRYYFRFDLETLLPAKKSSFERFEWGLKSFDTLANFFVDVKNFTVKNSDSRYVFASELSNDIIDFVHEYNGGDILERLQWVMKNPWLLQGKREEKYLFSSFVNSFFYSFITIYNSSRIIEAVVFVSFRDGHMKTLYTFGRPANTQDWAKAIRMFAVQHKAKMLTSYSQEINEALQTYGAGAITVRPQQRRYFLHKTFLGELPNAINNPFYEGDGDVVFS